MKQIIQDLKNGDTILEEVPMPMVKTGHVLIQTTRSLVSLGTERMLVNFGKANFIEKARQQPDKVKMVIDKVKTDGIKPTLDAVFSKLSQPLPLGYCNVGKVIGIGKSVYEFNIGDRVVSNGNHAEVVNIPKNLVAKIPHNVTDEEAAFTVIGSIGLQGIRLLAPTFGETIVVVGLGLIGLVTAELLKANGCNVIGFDFDQQKVSIAKQKGIHAFNLAQGDDPVKIAQIFTHDIGADGVIITASNKNDEIISQAAKMCRKRGRIILIGVIGLNISRADFYEKEITFQVSCSYGPGRYDQNYENNGIDYPIGFVRWTEKRNFEAILNALSNKTIDVNPLITKRIPLVDFSQIYDNMNNNESIACILEYKDELDEKKLVILRDRNFTNQNGVIGIIGAGNFVSSTMLPILRKLNANVKCIASSGGLSSTTLGKKFGISNSITDYNEILFDNEIDLVIISTKHNSHSHFVLEVMKSNKNIFVEKPLTIKEEELDRIIEEYNNRDVNLIVGFNRRFAPLAKKMKSVLGNSNTPINIIATMNAGNIPKDSWVHDMEIGGGRIIGEACHFIDLCTYLSGCKVVEVCMNSLGINAQENTDNASILLKYENGSNAVINYFSNGSKSYSKERIEVYSQDRTLIMDNWRRLTGYGFKSFSNASTGQDKGHFNQFAELLDQQKSGGKPIIPFEDIINTTRASFAAIKSFKTKSWITVELA